MVRWRRLPLLLVIAAAGGGLALVVPNTLNWKSDSPYLETARSVVNYREGSGRGRLVQYKNSARMSLHHPLLGVGPGNWAVVYPKFASPGDPSLATDGMTANPWPSSDWMTFLSERGPVAFVLLALAMIALLVDAVRALRIEGDPEHALSAWALLGTVSVLLVVSTFDAVLLLPAPALIAWGLLGALSPPSRARTIVALPTSSSGRGHAAGDDPRRSVDRAQQHTAGGHGGLRVEHASEPRGARRGARPGQLSHPPPTRRDVREATLVRERARARRRGTRAVPECGGAEAIAGRVRPMRTGTEVLSTTYVASTQTRSAGSRKARTVHDPDKGDRGAFRERPTGTGYLLLQYSVLAVAVQAYLRSGTLSTVPALSTPRVLRRLARASALTLTPLRRATSHSVSPSRTR